MRRLIALVPVALAVALLAPGGCGGASTSDNEKDFTGVKKDVAAAIDDFAKAARKNDADKICGELLTPALRAKLAGLAKRSGRGATCADQLDDSMRDADAFDFDVRSIAVTGGTAKARVVTKTPRKKDPVDTLTLVDQRGWRLSEIP